MTRTIPQQSRGRTTSSRRARPTGVPLASLLPSWELSLAEADKSPKTNLSYLGTDGRLVTYLKDHDYPDDTERVDAPHLRAFLLAEAGAAVDPGDIRRYARPHRVVPVSKTRPRTVILRT